MNKDEVFSKMLLNSSSKLHGLEHSHALELWSELLLAEECLTVDKDLLQSLFLYHDLGKAVLGDNLLTFFLDGPLSSLVYLFVCIYCKQLNRSDIKVIIGIWKHTRLFWFLGPTLDHFLYRPKNLEEKILFDLDLLDMINPVRLENYQVRHYIFKGQQKLSRLVTVQHLYFDWSKKHLLSLKSEYSIPNF